jgi:hypothetical protein
MKSTAFISIILTVCFPCLFSSLLSARAEFGSPAASPSKSPATESSVIHTDQLRHTGVHNAGAFYLPISFGFFAGGFIASGIFDPETGEELRMMDYPNGTDNVYLYGGAIWIGGIVDDDTLVSTGLDGWFFGYEIVPEYLDSGGTYRTGQYADDEFVTTIIDTIDIPFSMYSHSSYPIGLCIEMKSYSWADTLYDDFIILEYLIINIGGENITDGWIGFYFDNDVYHGSEYSNGWVDDLVGTLDTFLYDGDPGSRVLIPYGFDNDGDPTDYGEWGDTSVRGILAMLYLGSSFGIDNENFNWWISNGNPELDFGPRQLGTPEDPFREFAGGGLGTAVNDQDKYYLLSHPEIDYNMIETAIHDSSDGWIPAPIGPIMDFANGFDSRFLYSFGPFVLPPDDSVSFAIAVVMAGGLHVNPQGFNDYYDALLPHLFQETLDFSELMVHCRRADSVYRSGFLLPHPGPPAGIRVVDHNDAYISLAWHGSDRGDLAGYYLYAKDTVHGDQWNKATPLLIDTVGIISVFEPFHEYFIAVSLEDTLGRESAPSLPVSAIPGKPYPPRNLTITLDSLTPVLSWVPHDDTTLQVFLIRRAVWDEPFELYDSTAALSYRDYDAESGVEYHYMVSALSDHRLESEGVGPVTILPMALDRGILYCNMNRYVSPNPPLYPLMYLEHLFESVAARTTATMVNVDDEEITFKDISHYELIIVDESSALRSIQMSTDSLACYLEHGGRAVIIKPAFRDVGVSIQTTSCGTGSFYHDFLKLDSVATNAFIYQGGEVVGDLSACQSYDAAYPTLLADTFKLAEVRMPTNNYIPLSGYLFPTEEAEIIYSYVSSNSDTAHHGAVNGIKYVDDNYGFVLLSFPLQAMREQANIQALKQALVDLGVDMDCGDVNVDGRSNVGDIVALISYLYRDGPGPADLYHADMDCSGAVDVADIVVMINFIFKSGYLGCCN